MRKFYLLKNKKNLIRSANFQSNRQNIESFKVNSNCCRKQQHTSNILVTAKSFYLLMDCETFDKFRSKQFQTYMMKLLAKMASNVNLKPSTILAKRFNLDA